MDKLKAKWVSLTSRERSLVIIGAVVVVIGIVYYAIVSPLQTAVTNSQTQFTAQQNLLTWMQPRVTVLQSQSTGSVSAQPITTSELLPTVDTRLKQTAFAAAVGEVSQTTDNGVRVALNNAPFDDLMVWLNKQWQQSQIQVSDIDVQKADKLGLVNVTLTVTAAKN